MSQAGQAIRRSHNIDNFALRSWKGRDPYTSPGPAEKGSLRGSYVREGPLPGCK